MTDPVYRYVARHRRQAALAETARVPGHKVAASKDYAKAFASRPGSADWQASCTCGWGPKTHYYGEIEALAAAGRHLQAELRKQVQGNQAQGGK